MLYLEVTNSPVLNHKARISEENDRDCLLGLVPEAADLHTLLEVCTYVNCLDSLH